MFVCFCGYFMQSKESNKIITMLDPNLSRFDPLPRIISYDDFDHGLQGWTGLIGNYEETLDSMLPAYRDLRPPMLSNLSMWDTGTDGSISGTYAMKLATRAKAGSIALAIKRLTFRQQGLDFRLTGVEKHEVIRAILGS